MIHALAALAAFILLVAAGAAVILAERLGDETVRVRVRRLILVGLTASMFAGVTQRELWPFATWALIPGRMNDDVAIRALEGIDETGTASPIDYRAWSPLSEEELMAWIGGPFAHLDSVRQDSALATLLRMAERARVRVRSGGSALPVSNVLGPLAASTHLLHPKRWNVPGDVPAQAFVSLQLVERTWNLHSPESPTPASRVVLRRPERR